MTNNDAPGRDQVIRDASYAAAIAGYYDTSVAAQKSGALTVSVMDMTQLSPDPLPAGATARFYVMINGTGTLVTRLASGDYQTEYYDRLDWQRSERALRLAVLDAALAFLSGTPQATDDDAGRAVTVAALLQDGAEASPRDPADPVAHAVVRDLPEPPYRMRTTPQRHWTVEIGPRHRCRVAFFGTNADGSLRLVAQEEEQ